MYHPNVQKLTDKAAVQALQNDVLLTSELMENIYLTPEKFNNERLLMNYPFELERPYPFIKKMSQFSVS